MPNEGYTIEYMQPYTNDLELKEKFEVTLRALFQAKRLQNRSLQLAFAYYLGELLEEVMDPLVERAYYAKKLTTYYRITSIRAYFLFKPFGVSKIASSTSTSLTTLRKITTGEYQDLILRSTLIFNGVENWEESDVALDHVTGE